MIQRGSLRAHMLRVWVSVVLHIARLTAQTARVACAREVIAGKPAKAGKADKPPPDIIRLLDRVIATSDKLTAMESAHKVRKG